MPLFAEHYTPPFFCCYRLDTYVCLPAGELWGRPESYIHLIWNPQSRDPDAAQAVLCEVLRLLRQTGYCRLLTDQRQRATAPEDHLGWLLAIWLPQVGEGQRLTHVAVVTARLLDVRRQTVDVCTQGQQRYGIFTGFFTTHEAARGWLQAPADATERFTPGDEATSRLGAPPANPGSY